MSVPRSVEQIIQATHGLSVLRRFDIAANEHCSKYDLTLELSGHPREQSRHIRIRFTGISELRSKEFGGGLTQLPLLKVDDVGGSGVEGGRFEVAEVERNSLRFKCESIELLSSL